MRLLSAARRRLTTWIRRDKAIRNYARYLQEVAADPGIASLRTRAFERLNLQDGHHVVDLGCGPGTVTVQIAERVGPSGHVQGIDLDPHMIAAANELAAQRQLTHRVRHRVDNCTELSLEDDRFDACYCERVFQHLSGDAPTRAAKEILRILKPGGRFIVVDTNWLSVAINVCDAALGRRVIAAWVHRIPNPDAGIRLAEWLSGNQSSEIQVESVSLRLLPGGPTAALFTDAAEHVLSSQDVVKWSAALTAAQKDQLPFGSVNMVTVSGVKTGRAAPDGAGPGNANPNSS
jgi:SAM-dependent methyltransferase